MSVLIISTVLCIGGMVPGIMGSMAITQTVWCSIANVRESITAIVVDATSVLVLPDHVLPDQAQNQDLLRDPEAQCRDQPQDHVLMV